MSLPTSVRVVAGIFVGGSSRRMGGRPKGLLLAPAQTASEPRVTIVGRTVSLLRERCQEIVLVGHADAYTALDLPVIPDATTGNGSVGGGPLAGLVALLEHARGGTVIAVACDMPYLTGEMLAALVAFDPGAAAVAPREPGDAGWSPLFARYDAGRLGSAARAAFEAGERSLRAVLGTMATRELPLSTMQRRALRDWDTPADVEATDLEAS